MGFITAEMNLNGTLEKYNIIPDVLPSKVSPSTLLQVDYGPKDVALGNELTPQDTTQQPSIFFVAPDESAYYTLVMTDPDAPSVQDKKFGPWRHWVVVNISGSDLETAKKAENQQTPYIGPGPGENTGTHRYVFLLYQQKAGKQDFKPMEHEEKAHRRLFQLREFEAENQLELVTVNFFTCPT
ncbi:hypothetical protein INT47_001779 [Mucor saturninus]|uniref:Phosphatidylethanolamine-binding protein n=1 Tax=Mucor saturninus TaxID=64648 RepID=A0A8H7QUP9_9FUNG|nr:hypothetical protein INT47_001779 [Mucor saturninus]